MHCWTCEAVSWRIHTPNMQTLITVLVNLARLVSWAKDVYMWDHPIVVCDRCQPKIVDWNSSSCYIDPRYEQAYHHLYLRELSGFWACRWTLLYSYRAITGCQRWGQRARCLSSAIGFWKLYLRTPYRTVHLVFCRAQRLKKQAGWIRLSCA